MDEFGPLNLLPREGKQWAPVVRRAKKGSTSSPRRRRRRATYKRTKGVRHLLAALDMNRDRLYGHVKTTKNRTKFLEFCRYLRSLYPPEVRIAIVMDNYSPHLSTNKDDRVGRWARPTTSSWPMCLPTPRSSTGSSATSPRCATSLWTAPTTAPMRSRTR